MAIAKNFRQQESEFISQFITSENVSDERKKTFLKQHVNSEFQYMASLLVDHPE